MQLHNRPNHNRICWCNYTTAYYAGHLLRRTIVYLVHPRKNHSDPTPVVCAGVDEVDFHSPDLPPPPHKPQWSAPTSTMVRPYLHPHTNHSDPTLASTMIRS